MTNLRIRDLAPALIALRALALDHPDLPAPCVDVTTVYPDRVRLAFHDDLAGFEAWRAALGIDPYTVAWARAGELSWLDARGAYSNVPVHLTGYFVLCEGKAPGVGEPETERAA
ncbi:hypothetical protein [Streptomyces sp. CA-253872]|uniref:hypothetical protein n=1 Tax=Streptomyces sp. CA-253872 TaxID=3240067 RepID=UPI003D903DEA